MMDAESKKRWIAALRSGEYIQGKHLLRSPLPSFCYLGVLADVEGVPFESDRGYIFANGPKMSAIPNGFCGITPGEQYDLIRMNDGEGRSFAEIAEWVEGYL